jgi:hypothetical protein
MTCFTIAIIPYNLDMSTGGAPRTVWLIRPLVVFGLVVLGTLALGALPSPWDTWPRDGCQITNCYCEPLRRSFVVQPISAYSNWGYLLVGLLILAAPPGPPGKSTRFLNARLLGVLALLVAIGSFFSHVSLTLAGEWFDLVGLYAFTGYLALYNLARRRPVSDRVAGFVFLTVILVGGAQMIVARELQQIVFGVLAVAALAAEGLNWLHGRPPARVRYLFAALACLAVGGAAWFMPCLPGLGLPMHPLWHTLTAAAMGLLFVYLRSET